MYMLSCSFNFALCLVLRLECHLQRKCLFRNAIRRVQLNAVESDDSGCNETYLSVYELMT